MLCNITSCLNYIIFLKQVYGVYGEVLSVDMPCNGTVFRKVVGAQVLYLTLLNHRLQSYLYFKYTTVIYLYTSLDNTITFVHKRYTSVNCNDIFYCHFDIYRIIVYIMLTHNRLGYCFTPYQRLWLYNGAP